MILGLTGKQRSGKDTAYKFIEEWAKEQKHPVRRDAFADRLKLSVARLFNPKMTLEQAIAWCNDLKMRGTITVSTNENDGCCVSGRQYLQRYGTEAHREIFGQDFWLKPIETAYLLDDKELVVVCDVRFDNEARLIRDLGGEVWEVVRPGVIDTDTHASEVPVQRSLVNRIVKNDQDLKQFRTRVRLEVGSIV